MEHQNCSSDVEGLIVAEDEGSCAAERLATRVAFGPFEMGLRGVWMLVMAAGAVVERRGDVKAPKIKDNAVQPAYPGLRRGVNGRVNRDEDVGGWQECRGSGRVDSHRQ